MMQWRTILLITSFAIAGFSCRKPYQPAVIQINYDYLVMDGVINANPGGVTRIILSRTKNLTDTIAPPREPGAKITIEAQGGGSYTLADQGNGVYNSAALNLSSSGNYRLRIVTQNGSTYESDYVPVKQTPPIDSVTWKQKLDSPNKAVTIFAHSHDPQNNTRYYRWDFVETWQYSSQLIGSLALDAQGLIFYTDATTQISTCWGTTLSTNISTATSAALSQDVVSYVPVNVVPQNDEKMAIRYSINVSQYGLTKEAYNYWDIVKKSSQQTGSIFDPQPAQVVGNLHCTSNPAEPVIGYVSASLVTEKRIFIDKKELVDWHYPNAPGSTCDVIYIPYPLNDFRTFRYNDTTYGPYYFTSGPTLLVARKPCVDCRRRGGVNQKPSFWQ